MGLSLGLALAGWFIATLAWVVTLPLWMAVPAVAFALTMTAWFIAHVITFTVRALRSEATPCSHCGAGATRQQITRRHLIGIAGQAVAAATVLSVLNLPGARVFGQTVTKCGDGGGPLEIFERVCVGRGETEAQVRKRLEEQAREWIEENKGTFEARAQASCRDNDCKGEGRCALVDYRVTYHIDCVESSQCESRRACGLVIGMGVACRCLPRECSSTRFAPPVDIYAEVCLDKENPTKEELEEACKQAGAQVEAAIEAAAARACEKEPCPPVGGSRPACKADKVKATKIEVKRVKGRPNCCRATASIQGVQCKCDS
jgi:hypothetical protein